MSTTFAIMVNEKEVEVARRTGAGMGKVDITWLNDLVDILPDSEPVFPTDNTAQGVDTMEDLRFLAFCTPEENKIRDLEKKLDKAWKSFDDCDDRRTLAEEKLQFSFDIDALVEAMSLRMKVEDTEEAEAFWKSQANKAENERMRETEIASRLKEELDERKNDMEIQAQDSMETRQALSNALQESLDREAVHRKDIRVLERKLERAKWDIIETDNFTVTIFNENFSDGRGGSFEHHEHGEDVGGGLWFDESDFNGKKRLRDYDGVYDLPEEVKDALRAEGIIVELEDQLKLRENWEENINMTKLSSFLTKETQS